MSLDLGETILQLDRVARQLGGSQDSRTSRLQAFVSAASQVSPRTAVEKTLFAADRPFLAARVVESLTGSHAPASTPADWCVVSVDGSHIDVDRHLPVSCYLINLGGCVLTYGSRPDAHFFSQPHLAAEPSELYLADPASPAREEPVTGPLLGLVRTARELERLAQVVEDCPPDLPALALVDGSLVLWGLSGSGYPPFVREAIIRDRFLVALDRLRALARQRPLTLAAYVSLPRSTEVANAARCCLCPYDLGRCGESCGQRRSTLAPCDAASDFLDREIFQQALAPGYRSAIFQTNSSVSRQFYREHQIYFYYLHAGEEVARIEVPQWVARSEGLLSLGHSLILDLCRRGQGYPVVISEAHEQAVIRGSERQMFKQMVAEALERQGIPAYTSEKERSKRTPWV